LAQFLADGQKSANEVKEVGKPLGFSDKQLGKAADRIGVVRKPGGFGKGWLWVLPAPESESAA
jgi:hypothetical protein